MKKLILSSIASFFFGALLVFIFSIWRFSYLANQMTSMGYIGIASNTIGYLKALDSQKHEELRGVLVTQLVCTIKAYEVATGKKAENLRSDAAKYIGNEECG